MGAYCSQEEPEAPIPPELYNRMIAMEDVFAKFNRYTAKNTCDRAYEKLERRCLRAAARNPDILVYAVNRHTTQAWYTTIPTPRIRCAAEFIRDILKHRPRGNIVELSAYNVKQYDQAKEFAETILGYDTITDASYQSYRRAKKIFA